MRVNLSAIFSTSQLIATKSGQELQQLITTFADFVKQIVPVLQNGLTITDNFNAEAKDIELSSEAEQVVSAAAGKTVTDVIPGRVYETGTMLTGFGWWLDDNSELIVMAQFDPVPTSPVVVRLNILYV